jgi:hypothetical protein
LVTSLLFKRASKPFAHFWNWQGLPEERDWGVHSLEEHSPPQDNG